MQGGSRRALRGVGRGLRMCVSGRRGAGQEERLGRAEKRERSRFVRDYNDRLFNGLVIASLAVILLFRFVIRISLLETLGWVAFAFLQVYVLPCMPQPPSKSVWIRGWPPGVCILSQASSITGACAGR